MKKIFIKYIAEFLVVFLGILLSFAIDNKLKLNSEIENKNKLFILFKLEYILFVIELEYITLLNGPLIPNSLDE